MITSEQIMERDLRELRGLYLAYLAGFTSAKRLLVSEKLPRSAYRRTTFNDYIRNRRKDLPIATEEELSRWLDEYLASE